MKYADLPKWSKVAGDWAGEYYAGLPDRPVMSKLRPGEFAARIPDAPPEQPESMERIFEDFRSLVPDAMTHWQHPRFFAYFPANASPASIIAEQLANTMGCNCMLWQTSPAATELEQKMTSWLRDAVGLAGHFKGLTHDTATTATLCAVLTMRERALEWAGNEQGLGARPTLRLYASGENHSSVEKAARISGIGSANLARPACRADRSMDPEALEAAIRDDKRKGFLPTGVVVCVGGTATGASDRPAEIIEVAKSHGLYVHLDAAWAGPAMICEEFRWMWKGVEAADSVVINPSKCLGGQIDCSVQFLADLRPQAATLGLRPDYLRTDDAEDVLNCNELTVGLGRRFRALKLWFLLRAHGLQGLRSMFRNHVAWIKELEGKFESDRRFEIVASSPLALFAFRFVPSEGDPDRLTAEMLRRINEDGRVYLTPAVIGGAEAIRVTAGTYETSRDDVLSVYDIACEMAEALSQ